MVLNAYTLHDLKSLSYSPPFFAVTHGVAVRMLSELVSDQTTSVGRHPRDYVLYWVGSFDDASGELLQLSPLVHIADAVSLVRDESAPDLFSREGSGRGAGASNGNRSNGS